MDAERTKAVPPVDRDAASCHVGKRDQFGVGHRRWSQCGIDVGKRSSQYVHAIGFGPVKRIHIAQLNVVELHPQSSARLKPTTQNKAQALARRSEYSLLAQQHRGRRQSQHASVLLRSSRRTGGHQGREARAASTPAQQFGLPVNPVLRSAVRTELLRILISVEIFPGHRFRWTLKQHASRFIDQGIRQRWQIGSSWQLGEFGEFGEIRKLRWGGIQGDRFQRRRFALGRLLVGHETSFGTRRRLGKLDKMSRNHPLRSLDLRRSDLTQLAASSRVQRSHNLDLIAQKIRKF